MNTRLQVEHPVTELVTGLDLVEWQLRVAAGARLPYRQEDISLTGHAIEARLCATVSVKEGAREFLPSGGTVLRLHEPEGDGVRTDSGLSEGTEVGSLYDPMLSKVIAYGPDRETALRKLRAALAGTVTLGVRTTPVFAAAAGASGGRGGRVGHGAGGAGGGRARIGRRAGGLRGGGAAAVALALRQGFGSGTSWGPAPTGARDTGWVDPFSVPDGWRLGGVRAWTEHHLRIAGHDPVTVRVRSAPDGGLEVLPDGAKTPLGRPEADSRAEDRKPGSPSTSTAPSTPSPPCRTARGWAATADFLAGAPTTRSPRPSTAGPTRAPTRSPRPCPARSPS
ncbi:hypothetical protein SALBM311S_12141 [Streptomyces alboniger]